jgi:RNA polymerase sigma factor (sigma-70 family)
LNISKNIKECADDELILHYKKSKDKIYVGELYTRHMSFVLAVCMKYLKNIDNAKEAVIQIFEKLFVDLLKHNVENFKPWVYSVAKNYCLQMLRTETQKLKNETELKKNYHFFMEKDNALYLNNEKVEERHFKKLEAAILDLSEEQRRCIELFYLQEKCYEEVSKITGYDMNKVKSYIQNGKRNLKIFMMEK